LTPEVVGVHMTGRLREGVTATDLVLHVTQMLRAQKSSVSLSSFTAKARPHCQYRSGDDWEHVA